MSNSITTSDISRTSNTSISSAIALTRARKAALEVKKKAAAISAAKRIELERKKIELQNELDQQEISMEIAAFEAEEQALLAHNTGEESTIPCLESPVLPVIEQANVGDNNSNHNATLPPVPPISHVNSTDVPDLQRTNIDTRIVEPCATSQPSPIDSSLAASLTKLAEMTSMASLPRNEIIRFNGDPKVYVAFITNFKIVIERNVQDNVVRLNYLILYCEGQAKKLIEHCVILGDKGYQKALELLHDRYGSPYDIARTYIDSLTKGPVLSNNDTTALVSLSDDMIKCETVLNALGYCSDLNSSHTLQSIVVRLPVSFRAKWADHSFKLQKSGIEPAFSDLSEFIKDRADTSSSIFGKLISPNVHAQKDKNVVKDKNKSSFQIGTVENKVPQKKCYLCSGNHFISDCGAFKSKSYDDRVTFIKQNRLCFNCLIRGHTTKQCYKSPQCPKCKTRHHVLVHVEKCSDNNDRSGQSDISNDSVSDKASSSRVVANSAVILDDIPISNVQKINLRIVPVTIHGQNVKVTTYALLDNGSNVSLCTNDLLNKLNVNRARTSMNITTVTSSVSLNSFKTSFNISAVNENRLVHIDEVLSVDKLPISMSSMISKNDMSIYDHLQDIHIPDIDSSEVQLLIGCDSPEVFFVEDQRRGRKNEPYAIKTILGWSIFGPSSCNSSSNSMIVNFQKADLYHQVERMWRTDFSDSVFDNKTGMSVEDRHALDIFESSTEHDGERYYISLPWRDSFSKLDNNIQLAEHRLYCLKCKLMKNEELLKGYCKTIDKYITDGHAQHVGTIDQCTMDSNVWFLPHHCVLNPNKPGKVRVVFDCAAKYRNTSLNQRLLQGPDLVSSLIGVLMRFRIDSIAFMADVEAMFHQVRVKESDKKFLRFLWWPGGNLQMKPEVYCMTVHLFGATSSPSVCTFALKKTAQDFGSEFDSETVSTVLENFYVDDCLKTVTTVEEGIRLAEQLQSLLQKGGFNLTKFVSNKVEILNSLPVKKIMPSAVNIEIESSQSHKALGMNWNVKDDTFSFNVDICSSPLTKRSLLSLSSSLYDPLGLIAPVNLIPKLIFQKLCRNEIGWDDDIPEEDKQNINKWVESLKSLGDFHIDRCIKPTDLSSNFKCELHHFADASNYAYGVASYLRVYDESGLNKCTLIAGKSRLAPINGMTIPRLELSAAVVAVRLHQTITREMNLTFDDVYFWSDSQAVLQYITNITSRYKTFVANRLAIIHDVTKVNQWNYIPSNMNPADIASRGVFPNEKDKLIKWSDGPDFLQKSNLPFPEQPILSPILKTDEMKTVCVVDSSKEDVIEKLIKSSSSFQKLQRSIAWLTRFKSYCRWKFLKQGKVDTGAITLEEMNTAKRDILRVAQNISFPNEMQSLTSEKDIKKSSHIKSLCPILSDGLIRVGGRLHHSDISYDNMHPVILPSDSHVTSLIIRQFHEQNGHVGSHHTLAYIRQEYWILKGLTIVKRIISKCVICRRNNGRPVSQQMGHLPLERVSSNHPAFQDVGVDFFGVFHVRCKRTFVKRYGCIFTCMSSRAVHIEVAHSLSTESFLCCLNRFIARRGRPKVIFSDNGTNLKGANRELQSLMSSLNLSKVYKELKGKEIEWRFTTPGAPHEGGVWERLIRSIKSILRVIAGRQTLDDESLVTFLAEVERILNDRPLVPLSDDIRDPDPLTPSKLLLLRDNSCVPEGTFQSAESNLRRRWKQANYLADVFWKRWIKDYLPLLQTRNRWQRKKRNFKVGDIVLVIDDQQPRGKWPLGIVESVRPGHDGLVRTVEVRSQNSVKLRPVNKLCFLEMESI